MKRIFICSRYAGNLVENAAIAERLCRRAVESGCAPFAPHLLYARFLDENDESGREAGMACGQAFMEVCDEVWVFTGDGLSHGMCREVNHARHLGKPILEMKVV
jgi:hypothetical protein